MAWPGDCIELQSAMQAQTQARANCTEVRAVSGELAPAVRFERGVRPLLAGLRAAALRLTRDADEAEDLLQESVLRAWRFFSRYEPDSNLRAWLHRILRNTFLNRYRRARREREVRAQAQIVVELRAAPQVDPPALHASLDETVARELSTLPADFRAVLWAVAVDELSYREAAESLGCPVGTVMSRLHRGRHALQHALQPYARAHGYG
jgi:RNA polymerase sigma-70 factor (ECF subfamily)